MPIRWDWTNNAFLAFALVVLVIVLLLLLVVP